MTENLDLARRAVACNSPDADACAFADQLDADALDHGRQDYRSPLRGSVRERLEWHRAACVGSIDWFEHGLSVLRKSGGGSPVYQRAIENGRECLAELDRLLAALENAP